MREDRNVNKLSRGGGSRPVAVAIAAFAVEFDETRVGSALLEMVGRAVVDTCAVGLAGCNEDASVLALRYARATSGGVAPTSNAVRCWGRSEVLPLELAAFCNGVAAHVLDYDDVTSQLRGHPSAAMLPALFGLGATLNSSGTALAAAYIVGFEVICKISRAMAFQHYAKGWHSTSTIGGLGCAVACAKLLGLNSLQTTHAIGLAVAQAAGSRANFGTHAKSLQAGHANSLGIRSALLAREGFDASPDILEAQFGYMELYGQGESLAEEVKNLGIGPLELEREGLEVKKYPMCYATHRALDGLLDLRSEYELDLKQVKTVNIRTSAGSLAPLIHARPQTGLEAKFSMHYAVAAALSDGSVTLGSFDDMQVLRADVQRFFPAVTVSEDEGKLMPRWTDLEVVLHDGRRLSRRVETLRGSARHPLSSQGLRAKLQECVEYSSIDIDGDAFFDQAMHLGSVSVLELTACLSAPKTSPT